MSVVVLAYHEMGCMGLRTLLQRRVPIAAVYTYEDDPHENLWFGSVAKIARDAGIPVSTTTDINDRDEVERVRRLAPDVLFSFYYRDMLKRPLREIPRLGGVNLHGSLLPKYRGRSPVNWQLVHGERESGVTLHYMVARADAGDIVGQERVAVGPDDTAIELYRNLLPAAERVLERNLDGILAGTAPRLPQDESQATVFGGRRPEDGRIDWNWPSKRIHDLVRAVAKPWPGAFSEVDGRRAMIWRTRLGATLAGGARLQPGEVLLQSGRVLAGTGDAPIELLEVELPAGARLRSGDRFGTARARSHDGN